MARVFATKVWGFNPARWAVLGFSRPGSRDNLAREIDPEDWVLHIGTRTSGDTTDRDRGRLLGMARLGENPIATETGVEPSLWSDYLALNSGKSKWPFGLPMVEAREFIDRATLDEYDVIPRFRGANLGLVLGTNAVELNTEEAAAVLALPTKPCELFTSPELQAALTQSNLRRLVRTRRSIPPTPGERTSTYEDQPAHTYVLELTGRGLAAAVGRTDLGGKRGNRVYKVGYAIDYKDRAAQLNFAFPNLEELSWKATLHHLHADGVSAMAMEAHLHQLLDPHTARSAGNTETFICREDVLMAAWREGLTSASQRAASNSEDRQEGGNLRPVSQLT